jgi:hypothetical protein
MLTSKIVQRWRVAVSSFRIGSESLSRALPESSGVHGCAGTGVHRVVFCVSVLALYYPSGVRQTDCILFSLALARVTFARMSEAFAVQMNGFG